MTDGDPQTRSSEAPVPCSGYGGRPGCRLLGRVMANESLGGAVRLSVQAPGWRGARPGQFAILQAEPSRCFLGRALSISDEAGETVTFLVAPIGDGTRELAGLAQGDAVWLLGPLGNGFDVDALATSPGRAIIVAGGIGVAPFPLLLSRLAERCHEVFSVSTGKASEGRIGPEVLLLLGFRDSLQYQDSTPLREIALRLDEAGLRCRLEVVVEDGTMGPAEKATDLLRRHVAPGDRVAVCGPWAMCEAVWRVCRDVPDLEVWFSLETSMACGVGSCHGCVITLADGSYARVCHEGPVFASREVFGA